MIQLNVIGQIINPGANYSIIADSIDFVQIKFNFSQEWEGLTCTAQFTQNENTYNKLLDETSIVTMPAEIVQGNVEISVFGVLDGQTVLATTKPIILPVQKSGFKSDGEVTIPSTPTLLAQIIANIKDFSLADSTTDDLEEGSSNLYYTAQRADLKVDKETGKGLSTEDYTTTEKTKLAGIEEGANALPSKTGLTNKLLAINGAGVLEWVANVIGLPFMTGNSGKILTTNGTAASWSNTVTSNAMDQVGLIVKGAISQTANVFDVQNSDGTSLFKVDKDSVAYASYFRCLGIYTSGAGGSSYGYLGIGSNGITISRSRADANSIFNVNQASSGGTGNLATFQNLGIIKSYVDKDGVFVGKHAAADGALGVSGSFTTADSKTITVKDGLIVSIV